MTKLSKLLFTAICFFPIQLMAQHHVANLASRFYAGVQAGVPLFWGDIYSTGNKIKLGHAGGLALGYRAKSFIGIELNADYGVGKLGAASWQLEDYIDNTGTIQYTSGSWKLGEVYTETRFVRLGLRAPLQMLNMLSPGKKRRTDIELAPNFYFNHFVPGIYDAATKEKLSSGVQPANWSYAVGGDLGVGVNVAARSRVYFRSALSWLSDERFEGITTVPVWRVNLQLYSTLGWQIDLCK